MRYLFSSRSGALLIALLLNLLCAGWVWGAGQAHWALFFTAADAARVRDGVATNPLFARLARELAQRTATNRFEDLPALERQWWDAAKLQPWSQTYPVIFHHTLTVPLKWAELARDCARANWISPDAALLAKGKRTLLELSEYTFEFDHYDVGLNYTVWALAGLEAYDLLYSEFTAEERARLDACFDRYLGALRKNDDYWNEHEPGGKLNNHYAWHKLGLGMMGLFYDRPELVERALRGPKGVEFMLANGFKDDGLWLEGSIPYQLVETAPLLILAHLLENAGSPERLFQYRSSNNYSLKQGYDALIPLLFPDRTLPALGDAYGHRTNLGERPDWELLFRQFRVPTYAWLLRDHPARTAQALFWGLPELPPAAPPAQPSKLWPEMGYVALRSDETTNYWSGDGWSLFGTFSGQTVHAHADRLSVMLFANGHLWLPDCEARPSAEHAFSSVVQNQLNRETLCHNTLLVDRRSQRLTGQRLDLLEFTNLPALKRVSFGDLQGRLYDGVRQVRTLIVCPEYVVDFLQAMAETNHEFAWVTHVDGQPVSDAASGNAPVTLPPGAPWRYLHEPRGAGITNRLWECFCDGRQTFRMDLLADGLAEVVHCGFPRDDRSDSETIPMRLVTRRGTRAWFLAVYRIVKRPEEPLDLKVDGGPGGRLGLNMRLGGKSWRYPLPKF